MATRRYGRDPFLRFALQGSWLDAISVNLPSSPINRASSQYIYRYFSLSVFT